MWSSSSSAKRSQKNAATAEKATATAADATSAWQFATWHEIKLFDLSRRQRGLRGARRGGGEEETRLLRYSLNETKWCVRRRRRDVGQRQRRQRRSRWRYFGDVRNSPLSLSLSFSRASRATCVAEIFSKTSASGNTFISISLWRNSFAFKNKKNKITKARDTKHETRHRKENNNNNCAGILFYCFSPDSLRSCETRSFRFAWPSAWAAIRRSLIAFVYVCMCDWEQVHVCAWIVNVVVLQVFRWFSLFWLSQSKLGACVRCINNK